MVANIDTAQLTSAAEQCFIATMGKIDKAVDSLGKGLGLNNNASSQGDASAKGENKIYVKLANAGMTQLQYAEN